MRLTIACVVVVLIAGLVLAGCGGGNKLVGKWQGTGITFEFAADGKMTAGVMGMSASGTYKVEGNKLTMSGLVPGMPEVPQTFTVSGDTLTIGEGAKPMVLTRMK